MPSTVSGTSCTRACAVLTGIDVSDAAGPAGLLPVRSFTSPTIASTTTAITAATTRPRRKRFMRGDTPYGEEP